MHACSHEGNNIIHNFTLIYMLHNGDKLSTMQILAKHDIQCHVLFRTIFS